MMKKEWTLKKSKVALLGSVFIALVSCSDSPSEPGKAPITSLAAQSCGGSFSESQIQQADSLIILGNSLVVEDMKSLFEGVDGGSWEDLKSHSPAQANSYYLQALQVAPGYCKAQFAQAITATMRIVEDKEVDALMTKMNSSDEVEYTDANSGESSVFKKAFNLKSEDELPKMLLRINNYSENNNEITSTEVYKIVTEEFYPRLDSAISKLQGVYDQENFEFEIIVDDKKHQIDKGEIGPLLGGLKILKALTIAAVARDFSADLNGSMDWFQTITEIKSEDYDNLSATQKAALDHYTGLIQGKNGFGNLKSEWKAQYTAIPTLLADAIDNVIGGLEYGIYESENAGTQEYDLYIVGKGMDADVNPSDLAEGVEFLTRAQKYLLGKKTISWSKGTQSIEVNIPAIFSIDNPFKKLPYFAIRPYAEWNDEISGDTTWYYRPTSFLSNAMAKEMNLNKNNEDMYFYLSSYGSNTYVLKSYNYDTDEDIEYGALLISENPCVATYQSLDAEGSPVGASIEYPIVPCNSNSDEPYVDYINSRTKAPFYFTDASGKMTLDPSDESISINSPSDLIGKVVFPDPTFNGVFPGMTNENFWTKLENLDKVQDRVEYEEGYCDYYGWCEDGDAILPSNPSDLDFFIYFTSKL